MLVLERGVANYTWLSRIPLLSSDIISPDMGATSWYSEPMKHCDNRRDLLFLGEVLGGSSRINGMVYTRGNAADYDAWKSMGHPDWSFDKVLPYFMKSETSIGRPKSDYRGDTGWCQLSTLMGAKMTSYRPMDQSSVCGFQLAIQNLPRVRCAPTLTL